MDEGFDALLKKIREDKLPEYGSISYDGQSRQFTETFLLRHQGEDKSEGKSRLLRYLEELTPEEREAANLEIETKERAPYLLRLKGKTGDLPADRLTELRQRAQAP